MSAFLGTIRLLPGGSANVERVAVVRLGDNTAEAARQAIAAQDSAGTAEAFAGPTFANTTAGLAATSSGDFFAVNVDGIVTIYLNNAGTAVVQRDAVTASALAANTGAALIGTADGVTVQAKLDEFDNAIGGGAFSNTYASTTAALSNGVISTTGIVGGSSGTNGTFDLAFSGGAGTGAAGRFTVAGGALTSITITNPGTGYTSAPTLSFAASSGLTGASATAVIGARQPVGTYFYVPGSGNTGLIVYRVDAGPVATEVARLPSSTLGGIDTSAVASAIYRSNLFDKTAITDDRFVLDTGLLGTSVDYFASDWMAWPNGVTQVIMSRGNYIVQATQSGSTYTPVSGSYVNPASNLYVLTKASGATHFRVSGHVPSGADANTFMVIPGTAFPSEYIDFNSVIDGTRIKKGTFSVDALPTGGIKPEKLSFAANNKNLFNFDTILPNYFMGATGSLTANSTYSVSDYIPITPGQTYVSSQNGALSNLRFWCFFANTSGTVVSGGSNVDGNTFTAPAGAYYVRATFYNTQLAGAQIELGTTPTSWARYGATLTPNIYLPSKNLQSGWSGKRWGRLGDSISVSRPWANTVAGALGLTALDYGVGGTQVGGPSGSTTAMFSNTRINAMSSTLDLITFMGGTNDWFNNCALGSATSTNSEEFNGALNLMAERLITRFPDDMVVFFTPIWTNAVTWSSKGWSNAYTNTLGLTPRDYADAIVACGKRYNIPVVDLMAQLSWNQINITTYITNDGELLHPNTAGNNRMAQVYVGGLRGLEPVT